MAVHEQEFRSDDALIEKRFEGLSVVVVHSFEGMKTVRDAIGAVIPPLTAHAPFVVTVTAARVVADGGPVELELVDVGVEAARDDDLVVLQSARGEVGV